MVISERFMFYIVFYVVIVLSMFGLLSYQRMICLRFIDVWFVIGILRYSTVHSLVVAFDLYEEYSNK